MASSQAEGPSNPPAEHERVVVGRVRGARGLRGDLRVEVLSDNPDRFSPGGVVSLAGEQYTVRGVRKLTRGLAVKLAGVDTRLAAEALVGAELTVSAEELSSLDKGSYYHFEILGLPVLTQDGQEMGTLREILVTGGNDVYVVRQEGRRDLLVPAVADVVLDVDIRKGRIIVDLPDGLQG